GMRIAPEARRDDGLFDVYYAGPMSRWELFSLLPRVYTGAHVNHPKVHRLRGQSVRIVPGAPLYAHVDGDLIPTDNLTFRVQPQALAVAVPAHEAEAVPARQMPARLG
ncbi:MAG TPA: hypothetical protein VD902_05675, partial [Symbiobacteriaceae bacterium]|nr:hypothetical protein [Symbiobacteriaceae bacterium]